MYTTNGDPSTAKLHRRRRRRRCLICCGACFAVTAVIAVVLLIVGLTVYKVREPVMTMNSVKISNLNLGAGSSITSPLAVNLTVDADVSVENPNAVSFRFGQTTTGLYYRAREIAVAYGPPGTAPAHGTFRVNVTVDVMADRVVGIPGLAGDLAAGKLGVATSTRVGGRVKIFGVIRHHVDVEMNCSLTVAVVNQSILDQSCGQRVWL